MSSKRRLTMVLACCFVFGLYGQVMGNIDSKKLKAIDPLGDEATLLLTENLEDLLALGNVEFRKGNYPQAARCFLYLLQRDTDNPALMFGLAECYARWGHPRRAGKFLLHAVQNGLDDAQRVLASGAFAALALEPGLRRHRATIQTMIRNRGRMDFVKSTRLASLRIHLPAHFKPEQTYTLLIGLHGSGGNGANFARIQRHFGKQKFIFACPQGPYEQALSPLVPDQRYSWDLETRNKELWRRGDHLILENILEVQRFMSERYHIADTYLLGFSQGAAYAWATAIRHSDRIRGVICFAGILPPADKPWSLYSNEHLRASARRLRVFVAHGRQDAAIGWKNSEKIAKKLLDLGYAVDFQPFSGGHELPPAMLRKAARWLMNPPPSLASKNTP